MERLIAIGDIHGQNKKLEQLLELIRPTDQDQLVFLGDYIDRGPDTQGVIELLFKIRESWPNSIFLKGNHEQMLLNALVEAAFQADSILPHAATFSDIQLYLQNGGAATLKSYDVQRVEQLPQAHIDFIRQTRLYFRRDGFLFVHAGARNDLPLDQQNEYTLLWDRNLEPGIAETHVVGHTPTADGLPSFEKGRYSLDTGAGHGRPLTACEVRTKQYWQS